MSTDEQPKPYDVPKAQPRRTKVNFKEYPHVEDKSDMVAWNNSQEQKMRESMIARERLTNLKEQISDCYRREGVNHYVKCKHLTTKYVKLWRLARTGMLTLRPNEEGADGNDDDDDE